MFGDAWCFFGGVVVWWICRAHNVRLRIINGESIHKKTQNYSHP